MHQKYSQNRKEFVSPDIIVQSIILLLNNLREKSVYPFCHRSTLSLQLKAAMCRVLILALMTSRSMKACVLEVRQADMSHDRYTPHVPIDWLKIIFSKENTMILHFCYCRFYFYAFFFLSFIGNSYCLGA